MKTERKQQLLISIVSLIVTLAVWALDSVVQFEISLFILYLVPIGVAAHLGVPYSGYALAFLASIAWFVSNNGVDPRLQGALGVWNIFTRVVVFFGLALYASRLRVAQEKSSEARESASVLPAMPQLVCERCERVSDRSGEWSSPLQFLKKSGELHSCICPGCVGAFLAKESTNTPNP